jgi:hypothetical protein
VWVGLKLDEPSAERRQTEIRRRYAQRRLGTLALPITKWHSKHELKFRLTQALNIEAKMKDEKFRLVAGPLAFSLEAELYACARRNLKVNGKP